ncbi:MAG: biopolymer transporter ExbD [Sandaracinaceae bacterium]|nr:biopolymer transporter ExbD [Sandaracinaceae bacterium]
MSEAEEKHATMAQVKRIIRKKLRLQGDHTHTELNIYPLMDVMTILLVFMIMQFAQEAAAVVQGPTLQIPWSTADTEPQDALPIQISFPAAEQPGTIVVDGRPTVELRRNGTVDPSQKQGGGTGFLITPLHNVMTQHRDRLKLIEQMNPNRPFNGTVQIICDKRIPFRTLSEVIYTLGQAEFSNIHFVVLQGGD